MKEEFQDGEIDMNRVFLISAIIILLVTIGCSRGTSMVTPAGSDGNNNIAFDTIGVGVSEYDNAGNPVAGYGALGLFNLHIDSETKSAELTPIRSNTSTDVLEVVDITNFLRLAPCSDCAKLMSVELSPEGYLVVSIGIKHPFDAGDPFKPITGQNRADLHVFNVEGLIVGDGVGTTSFTGMSQTLGYSGLVNADGYSTYLDNSLDAIMATESSLHPYILHFDDYSEGNYNAANPTGFQSVTDPPPSGNLVMAMGCDYDVQDYIFDMEGDIDFLYAVGCTYAVSADGKALRFTPEYRVPQHLKKAASEVTVSITNNELADGDPLSSADLEIHVVDINHGVAVGEALDEMASDSSVAEVSVEIPGVTSGTVFFGSTPVSGTGHDPLDPLVFTGSITNAGLGTEGTHIGMVKVLDSYSAGQNQSPLLDGMDGISRVDPISNPLTAMFAITEFATYAAFTIDIGPGGDLIADIQSDPAPPDAVTCQFIRYDASGSQDTFGYNIVEYQWDWDYTGIPAEFTADKITTDPYAKHQYATDGSHSTALRIVNDAPTPVTSEVVYLDHSLTRPLPTEYQVQEVNKVTDTDSSTEDMWMSSSNAIVVDDENKVHIFAKLNNVLYHNEYDDGVVTTESFGVLNGYSHHSAQIDSNNVIHLIWYNDGMNYVYGTTDDWSSPVVIAQSTAFESGPYSYSLGINGQDELMVLTMELFTPSHNMLYFFKDTTGTWSSPAVLTNPPTETGGSGELAVMVSCAGTPGDEGKNFHAMWTEQFVVGSMNPSIAYSEFDRETETWTPPTHDPAPGVSNYMDWSDMMVTSDGDVFIGGSYAWRDSFVTWKDSDTDTWATWWIGQTSAIEYTSTVGANDDGTVCLAFWRTPAWGEPIQIQYKVFHEDMSQAEVNALPLEFLDPSNVYEYRYSDIFMKECNFYVAYEDSQDTMGGTSDLYFARISHL